MKKVLYIIFLFFTLSFDTRAQVVADFYASDTVFCTPAQICFQSTSTGYTSLKWDIGSGSPIVPAPMVCKFFSQAGIYTITLTAYNGADSSVKQLLIHAHNGPQSNFSYSVVQNISGVEIQFIDLSTPTSDSIAKYIWSLGDSGST